MKTNEHARKVLKLRHWAAVAAVLLLVSAECWMMCSIGHSCGQMTSQPPVQVPSIGDLFAGL
jgi:hypothetical protein